MKMSAQAEEQFRFVNLLALELTNGDISLPSLPDVVVKIRNMLEKDDVDFHKISGAVSVSAGAANPRLRSSAATPGRVLPSSSSRLAPPPVET